MAEYNPSKIIKDGNTYNFRDTTKIPLAGSNEISGSLIPSTDGTVNLGGPSYQWNNAYIKSLTINGVVCGDILTHNASEFVDVSSNQTVGGTKRFKAVIIRNEGNFTAGEAPATQTSCMVLRHTNNDGTHVANAILSYMFNTGETMCELTQIPCIGSLARTWFRTFTDGTYSIYSYTKNGSLGTPGYQWKDVQTEKINNLNPSSLSLPNTLLSAMIQIDTTSWVLDGETDVEYTPLGDGYLTLAGNQNFEWAKGQIQNDNYFGIYRFTYKYDSVLGGIQGVTIPCIKGKKVVMKIKGTGFYNALFTYCQGNV